MNYKENKQVLLTLFITMIMMVTTIFTYGQTTINPDTVCANAVGEQYFVTNTATSTYQWTITGGGGALQTGQGSNSITVDWGGVSGLYPNAVEVIETNAVTPLEFNFTGLISAYVSSFERITFIAFLPSFTSFINFGKLL